MSTHVDYALEGDNSAYANDTGQVVPVVTRSGEEDGKTGQTEGASRVSGVGPQHTPATKKIGERRVGKECLL